MAASKGLVAVVRRRQQVAQRAARVPPGARCGTWMVVQAVNTGASAAEVVVARVRRRAPELAAAAVATAAVRGRRQKVVVAAVTERIAAKVAQNTWCRYLCPQVVPVVRPAAVNGGEGWRNVSPRSFCGAVTWKPASGKRELKKGCLELGFRRRVPAPAGGCCCCKLKRVVRFSVSFVRPCLSLAYPTSAKCERRHSVFVVFSQSRRRFRVRSRAFPGPSSVLP